MTIPAHNPLHHLLHQGGVSPNGPSSTSHSTQPSHEVAAHAANGIPGTTQHTEIKFLPLHVFNPHAPNLMGRNVPRGTSLQERRERSKQARSGKTRRGSETSVNDAVVAVAGRARTAGVSLTLNLQSDPRGGEQHSGMETEIKARKPNPDRPNLYMKTAKSGEQTDLSSEDANRMFQSQDGDEPGRATSTLAELEKAINERFPTWPELRQAIIKHMRKLESQLDPKERERLMRVTLRELRNGSIKMHTTIDGVVFELTALGLTNFFIELAGPENCEGAMTIGRRMSIPVSAY